MLLSEFTFGLGILDAITTSHGFKVVAENFVYFLGGAWYTIFITTLSVAMGMVLGLFAGKTYPQCCAGYPDHFDFSYLTGFSSAKWPAKIQHTHSYRSSLNYGACFRGHGRIPLGQ
jgi:hypothetical protein